MATYTSNTDLATQLISDRRVWAGGGAAFSSTGTINVDAAVTVEGDSMVIVAQQIDADATLGLGAVFRLSNSTIDMADVGGEHALGGSTPLAWQMEDVTYYQSGTLYRTIGNWHDRTILPTYIWDNFIVSGDVDQATAQVGINFFTGAVHADSSFSGVQMWNGEPLGAGARGGGWQTTSAAIYDRNLVGPFGTALNGADLRVITRFANVNPDFTVSNHTGLATNMDFRSLNQVTTALVPTSNTLSFILEHGVGNMAFINWLPGQPQNAERTGFDSRYGAGFAQVFIGTNPSLANPVGTDGDHLLTFPTSASTNGMINLQGAWDVATPTLSATGVDESGVFVASGTRNLSNPTGAILWRNQKVVETAAGADATFGRFNAFTPLATNTYRKYSWLQQPSQTVLNAAGQTHRQWMDDSDPLHVFDNFVPDDSQSSGFGKLITVTPPTIGAVDTIADETTALPVSVERARANGYDIFNGATWETSTDISDGTDIIMRDANGGAFDTFNKAFAIGNGGDTGGFTTGSGVLAGMKALAYRAATGTSDGRTGGVDYVGTTNNLIETHYTVTGTTVDFDGILGLHPSAFDYRTADIEIGGENVENRFVRINHNGTFLQDEFVTAFTAEQIRINGDVDGSQANCDLSARDSIRFNSSISNLALRARKTDGLGTISAPDNDGPTPSLLTYDADIILARQPSGTYTTHNLLGSGYAITGGAYNTLRTETGKTYTIEATDANVAEFGLTANADGTGGELQRGSSVTIAPTGYGSITWMRPAAPIAARPILIDMPAGTTGRFEINNQTNDTVFYAGTWAADGTVTATTDNRFTDADGVVGVASNDATVYQWFIKPTSVVGGAVYRLNGGTFQGTAITEGGMANITTTQVNNFFVQNAVLDVNEGTTTRTYPALTTTSAANKFNFIFSGTSSTSRPSGNGTQALLIEATNLPAYWTWLVTNNYQADPVDYRPASTIWNNSADDVTGIATADGVFCNSTASNVGNFCSNAGLGLKTDDSTLAGSGQVQSSDEDQASLATVNNAIAGLFASSAGVTSAEFEAQSDINNNVLGWLVGNETGVKLRRGNPIYDPSEDYTDNVENN